jgi:hypothetical protein
VRRKSFSPGYAAERDARRRVQAAMSSLTGIPASSITPNLSLGNELEEGELPELMASLGVTLTDYTQLAERGTVEDITRLVARRVYLSQVEQCQGHEEGSPEYRAAGCKRSGEHQMIPRGRLSFKDKGRSPDDLADHPTTRTTLRRWSEPLPPYDRRTQSPASQRAVRGRSLGATIKEGLLAYRQESGQGEAPAILIPLHARPLTNAGVPEKAASILVRDLGGIRIPIHAPSTSTGVYEALSRLIGGAALESPHDRPLLAFQSFWDARRLRGSMRELRPFLLRWRKETRGSKERGFMVPIRRLTLSSSQGPVVRFDLEDPDLLPEGKIGVTLARTRPPWTLAFVIGNERLGVMAFSLQHSDVLTPQAQGPLLDYNTLRGFTFLELPNILARKLQKRSSRRGRAGKAKRNPSTTAHLLPNPHGRRTTMAKTYPWPLVDDYTDDWHWDTQDAFPPSRSVPTARRNKARKKAAPRRAPKSRAASTKQIAWRKEFGALSKLAHKIQQERGCGLKSAFAKARQMAKENPRVLWPRRNQYSQVWGEFGPSASLPPVNRRNPRKKKATKKAAKKVTKRGTRRARPNASSALKAEVARIAGEYRSMGYDRSAAMSLAWEVVKQHNQ